LLIADEPIASLDPKSARRVMDILADMNRRDGLTVLVSLHQVEYALKYCPRTIALQAGTIAYDGPSNQLTVAMLSEIYGAEESELLLLDGASKPVAWATESPTDDGARIRGRTEPTPQPRPQIARAPAA
jgi:phosphonate transport system ATP-binding protein